MLYCTGPKLTFIDWLCGTVLCHTLAVSLRQLTSTLGRLNQNRFCLPLIGRHERSMFGEGMTTLLSRASLLNINF